MKQAIIDIDRTLARDGYMAVKKDTIANLHAEIERDVEHHKLHHEIDKKYDSDITNMVETIERLTGTINNKDVVLDAYRGEVERLKKVLQTIYEITDDDIKQERGFGTGIYQIEANARAALGIEVES